MPGLAAFGTGTVRAGGALSRHDTVRSPPSIPCFMTSADLNSGPVSRKLVQVSAPMSLGILGVLLVGLSDAFFLARLGEAQLAAIGFVYPVIVAVSVLRAMVAPSPVCELPGGVPDDSKLGGPAQPPPPSVGFVR